MLQRADLIVGDGSTLFVVAGGGGNLGLFSKAGQLVVMVIIGWRHVTRRDRAAQGKKETVSGNEVPNETSR